MMPVNALVEGVTDEPVARRLLKHVGLDIGRESMVEKGKPIF